MLAGQFPEVAAHAGRAAEEVLAFSASPGPTGAKLWSTNPLERLNGEIKRRSNVVGIFPNDAAIARLVTAVVVETHDEWAVAERRYLSEDSMAQIRQGELPMLTVEAPRRVDTQPDKLVSRRGSRRRRPTPLRGTRSSL